jgi:hypothetical protein
MPIRPESPIVYNTPHFEWRLTTAIYWPLRPKVAENRPRTTSDERHAIQTSFVTDSAIRYR